MPEKSSAEKTGNRQKGRGPKRPGGQSGNKAKNKNRKQSSHQKQSRPKSKNGPNGPNLDVENEEMPESDGPEISITELQNMPMTELATMAAQLWPRSPRRSPPACLVRAWPQSLGA